MLAEPCFRQLKAARLSGSDRNIRRPIYERNISAKVIVAFDGINELIEVASSKGSTQRPPTTSLHVHLVNRVDGRDGAQRRLDDTRGSQTLLFAHASADDLDTLRQAVDNPGWQGH